MHQWIGVLRMGALLSLGWVVCAALAWERFGVIWAFAILIAWLLLLLRFHRAVEALARGIAERRDGAGEA